MSKMNDSNPQHNAPSSTAGVPYPEHLKIEKPPYRPRVMRVAVDRFIRRDYHDREVDRIWKRSWQWACREEQIPDVGDYIVYEIADLSFIVVRTELDEVKAYWNSCLHRGRKLCTFNGRRAKEFRCMFHGWAWNIKGEMTNMTCGWDFPGTREEVTHLPEAQVGMWGGFVFINPDPDAESLESFLGELPNHFEGAGHDLRDRWVQAHVQVEVAANWKVTQEAFLEAWHTQTTHPQIVRSAADRANTGTRWDDFGNWMRGAPALPTDQHKSPPGWGTMAEKPQQVINQHYDFHLNEDPLVTAGDNENPDAVINHNVREYYRELLGDAVDEKHDVELRGGEMVSVWPNFHPWGGFSRLVYRFRPYKGEPERSVMDVLLLAPRPRDHPRPPPAPVRVIGPGQSVTDAPELGHLARIFEQDVGNMAFVQEGLRTSHSGYVILSRHNEAPVRKFHDMYDKWMGFEEGDFMAKVQPDGQ